ncbi:hypothetical protein D3C81_857090 [compost metagenome]
MALAVAGVAEPVQAHAEIAQVAHGRCVLFQAAQQSHGFETEARTSRGQRMQMIGVGTAEADQPAQPEIGRLAQIRRQLEPFVAGNLLVDQVQTQQRELDAGSVQPVESHVLQRWDGLPVGKVQGNQFRPGCRPLPLCRLQQLLSPSTKRLGVSTRSTGIAQRSPLDMRPSQVGC